MEYSHFDLMPLRYPRRRRMNDALLDPSRVRVFSPLVRFLPHVRERKNLTTAYRLKVVLDSTSPARFGFTSLGALARRWRLGGR